MPLRKRADTAVSERGSMIARVYRLPVYRLAVMTSLKQQIRYCTSADGTRIAYAISGAGPPLVLSANWLTHLEYQWSHLAWRPMLEALSRRHTVLRYDARGCGLSDWDAPDLSFETWLSDFDAVVGAAGMDTFPIVGVCQGGAIAMEYAARHPTRVSHLVLFGAWARGRLKRPEKPEEAEVAEVRYQLARLGWAQETHAFMEAFATTWQPGGTAQHLRSWCQLQRATTTAENAVRHMRLANGIDVTAAARQVQCPTLVIHADRDRVVPVEEARLCAKLILNARFVQLDSENHLLLEDEPAWARLQEELQTFLPSRPAAREREPFCLLSNREAEILELIAQGRDNAQIAAHLALSGKTVRNNITCVFSKLEVENRAQAIVLAREGGFGRASA